MQVLSSLLHRFQLLILRVQTVQLCKKYGCRKSVSSDRSSDRNGEGRGRMKVQRERIGKRKRKIGISKKEKKRRINTIKKNWKVRNKEKEMLRYNFARNRNRKRQRHWLDNSYRMEGSYVLVCTFHHLGWLLSIHHPIHWFFLHPLRILAQWWIPFLVPWSLYFYYNNVQPWYNRSKEKR